MNETSPPGIARIANGVSAPPAEAARPAERSPNIPKIPNLPPREEMLIWQYRQRLKDALKDHSTVILAAGTGSGKTRGGSEIALETLGPDGKMIVTENLRRATEKSATTVAADLQVELGKEVGIRNRYTHEFSSDTRLLFCPVQSLLVIMEDDPLLERYNLIAMDEVHKESKANELAMIRLREIQAQRKQAGKAELKLMFVSATADKEKISRHFPDAVPVDVPGETYPVDEEYLKSSDIPVADLPRKAAEKVRASIAAGDKGNILVFLSGKAQINEAAKALEGLTDVDIIAYHGASSEEEQSALFAEGGKRKVVLATNAAQESLTLDVNIVVDTGMHKHNELEASSGRQFLIEQKAPQDHLTQRRGRVGRKKSPFPGQRDKYYALFSEKDRDSRPVHEDAEMQRTDIRQEILLLLAQGNTDVYNFPFINRPSKSHLDVAMERLTKIGAVKDGRLTERGRLMAELQIEEPSLASMVAASVEYGAVKQASALAAMMESYDEAIDSKNGTPSPFRHPDSDALGYIQILQTFHNMSDNGERRRWARTNGLNYFKLNDAERMYNELLRTIRHRRPDMNLDAEETRLALDRSIYAGFADSLIKLDRNNKHFLEKVGEVQIDKYSVLNGKKPPIFVTMDLQPIIKDTVMSGRRAKVNHIISEDVVKEAPQPEPLEKQPVQTPATPPVAAGETKSEPLPAPAEKPVEKAEEKPTEPTVPPKPPTLRERFKGWLSHSIFGKFWRWFTS